jgi:hypothetical protein
MQESYRKGVKLAWRCALGITDGAFKDSSSTAASTKLKQDTFRDDIEASPASRRWRFAVFNLFRSKMSMRKADQQHE